MSKPRCEICKEPLGKHGNCETGECPAPNEYRQASLDLQAAIREAKRKAYAIGWGHAATDKNYSNPYDKEATDE